MIARKQFNELLEKGPSKEGLRAMLPFSALDPQYATVHDDYYKKALEEKITKALLAPSGLMNLIRQWAGGESQEEALPPTAQQALSELSEGKGPLERVVMERRLREDAAGQLFKRLEDKYPSQAIPDAELKQARESAQRLLSRYYPDDKKDALDHQISKMERVAALEAHTNQTLYPILKSISDQHRAETTEITQKMETLNEERAGIKAELAKFYEKYVGDFSPSVAAAQDAMSHLKILDKMIGDAKRNIESADAPKKRGETGNSAANNEIDDLAINLKTWEGQRATWQTALDKAQNEIDKIKKELVSRTGAEVAVPEARLTELMNELAKLQRAAEQEGGTKHTEVADRYLKQFSTPRENANDAPSSGTVANAPADKSNLGKVQEFAASLASYFVPSAKDGLSPVKDPIQLKPTGSHGASDGAPSKAVPAFLNEMTPEKLGTLRVRLKGIAENYDNYLKDGQKVAELMQVSSDGEHTSGETNLAALLENPAHRALYDRWLEAGLSGKLGFRAPKEELETQFRSLVTHAHLDQQRIRELTLPAIRTLEILRGFCLGRGLRGPRCLRLRGSMN